MRWDQAIHPTISDLQYPGDEVEFARRAGHAVIALQYPLFPHFYEVVFRQEIRNKCHIIEHKYIPDYKKE